MKFTVSPLTNREPIEKVLEQIAPDLAPLQKLLLIKWLGITRLELEVDILDKYMQANDPHGYMARRLATIKAELGRQYDVQ